MHRIAIAAIPCPARARICKMPRALPGPQSAPRFRIAAMHALRALHRYAAVKPATARIWIATTMAWAANNAAATALDRSANTRVADTQ